MNNNPKFQHSGSSGWIVSLPRAEFPGATSSWPEEITLGTISEHTGKSDVWQQTCYEKDSPRFEGLAKSFLDNPFTRKALQQARVEYAATELVEGDFIVRIGAQERRFFSMSRATAWARIQLSTMWLGLSDAPMGALGEGRAEFWRSGQTNCFQAFEIDYEFGRITMASIYG